MKGWREGEKKKGKFEDEGTEIGGIKKETNGDAEFRERREIGRKRGRRGRESEGERENRREEEGSRKREEGPIRDSEMETQ